MTFLAELEKYQGTDWEAFWPGISEARVLAALGKDFLSVQDFLALLSPAALPHLETMAQKAHELTLRHFGKTVLLYSPMYLSNYCANACTYCGFNANNKIPRKQLTLAEVEAEGAAIAQTGIRHLLILTGDAQGKATLDYILECLQVLKKHFLSLAVEIYAVDQKDYARLIAAGVDQLTLYQETYNPGVYARVHPQGPKKDYTYRLLAPERAAQAQIRAVNIGALLGLDEWRREAFFTGLHAAFLQARFPALEVSVSAPRLRPHAGCQEEIRPVHDADVVQFLLAARLFMPRLGLTLSTRENAAFRNRLLPLGITRMSAGSSTAVGGHTQPEDAVGQFEIADHRGVPEMQAALRAAGYQPIFTDWHAI